MKHLTITYDGRELFDGDVAELQWTDGDGEVKIAARTTPRKSLGDVLADVAANGHNGKTLGDVLADAATNNTPSQG